MDLELQKRVLGPRFFLTANICHWMIDRPQNRSPFVRNHQGWQLHTSASDWRSWVHQDLPEIDCRLVPTGSHTNPSRAPGICIHRAESITAHVLSTKLWAYRINRQTIPSTRYNSHSPEVKLLIFTIFLKFIVSFGSAIQTAGQFWNNENVNLASQQL